MKYKHALFTFDLKERIAKLERELLNICDSLLKKYQPLFAEKNLLFEIELRREGNDPFEPGYDSSVLLFIVSDKVDEVKFHLVPIWECQRAFWGLPVSKNVPGSRIFGELVDETVEEINSELEENIMELLTE
ncbi:hypothetical protein [Cohnella sp.]|uniref:hypothetical protein n=1 Tax=Cohnella sp. TaxID=1883426 RepID=UPI0035651AAA